MADSNLDSIVKGAPQPGHDLKSSPVGTSGVDPSAASKTADPLHNAPSSPSMIYLNMLILEASLRAQYLALRARRRKHTFFLSLLSLWLTGFGYALFLAPREDGSGVGGSVYWVVDMSEKVCFIGGIVTGILVWATGIWDRGIRWPRRWFAITNRGLRGFNCKLVIMKRPWLVEIMSTLTFFFTYGAYSHTTGQYRFVDPGVLREVDRELNLGRKEHPQLPFINSSDEEKGGHEEDLAPGGDYVKLLLWPKPFSANFRENWEIYRNEYWERENERRALLGKKLQARDRGIAKQQRGWFWWLPGRRRRAEEKVQHSAIHTEHERSNHNNSHHHNRTSAIMKESKRARSGSGTIRRGSTSAGSSRASTPPVMTTTANDSDDPGAIISRKASTGSNASDSKRRKKQAASKAAKSQRGPGGHGHGHDSSSAAPENPSPLARGSSVEGESVGSVW